jgi:hypothetical protein
MPGIAHRPLRQPGGGPRSLTGHRWWLDLGEEVRLMTVKKVPTVQAAHMIFKGH